MYAKKDIFSVSNKEHDFVDVSCVIMFQYCFGCGVFTKYLVQLKIKM